MRDGVLCVGAAHVDRKAYAQTDVRLKTSIPVRSETGLGGVARNVAENLVRLGTPVALISRIGGDAEGDRVRREMAALGIDLAGLTTSDVRSTASYTAVLEAGGELVVGLADMEIYEELTPERVDALPDERLARPIWFLDTNLSAATLERLAGRAAVGQLLTADPVSVPKASRLLPILGRIDVLFPSREEAELLSGLAIRTPAEAQRAAEQIAKLGVGQVIITLGSCGVCAAGKWLNGQESALTANVRDVTGAGDALIAGYLHGLAGGQSALDAIRLGIAAATLTVEHAATVHPEMGPELIRQKMEHWTKGV
ncbi:carbohydrate kinase family protein [Tumebacillus sp. DT12]|uniref:Carbohydrate kinase family protein n=1 Tax=Tumebacillus lacus TaxID=2995335 RepID=A0ABT3X1Z4_9BACL|nr:carbohydrate kinase family protein [Tumebacillus lacus]MCX7570939.1 carbohydrate kinase family protein [Tumebacillus lacus]